MRDDRHVEAPTEMTIDDRDWEAKIGHAAAASLAFLEAKRFLLLTLEMFVEWQVIDFAGGLSPVVLTLVDVSLGLPCALAAVYAIRKRRVRRRSFQYLLTSAVTTCAILNLATLISIGCSVNVRPAALAEVFNASMRFYVSSTSRKYQLDELQLTLRCCGHSSYRDWFEFDWQRVDYGPREDMAVQPRMSDEEVRPKAVPFSCCNRETILPCIHTQMTDRDVRSVNAEGCASSLSGTMLKFAVVGYVMTIVIAFTQLLLALLVPRVLVTRCCECEKSLLGNTMTDSSVPESSSENDCESSATTTTTTTMNLSRPKKHGGRSANSRQSSTSSRSSANVETTLRCETARIKPSVHVELRLPERRSCGNRVRRTDDV